MKATAIAPSNIAFIKYWGVKDEELRIPANASISMNLSNLITTTTVEFNPALEKDSVVIAGEEEQKASERVIAHLERVRLLAKVNDRAKVVSHNNFPSSTGLSSSASGFAALTLAAAKAAGLQLSEKELSILARQGSGSACRSIPDGFVEWLDGDTSDTSYAISLYESDYWDIVDVVVLTSNGKKETSSSEGHARATTSPFFEKRLELNKQKSVQIKKYLAEKNFTAFGKLVEAEALELHAIYLTSQPSLVYLLPATVVIIQEVKKWRQEGIDVYFTLNTGQDVHLICKKENAEEVASLARSLPVVHDVIISTPAKGAHLVENHLF